MSHKIEIKHLSFEYESKKSKYPALNDINITIDQGEFICLLGNSGCGKSTLLSILSGLNKPSNGELLIDEKPVLGPGVDRAVVFQHYSLFPWLTAKGNVLFGIKQSGKKYKKDERDRIANYYLKSVELFEEGMKISKQCNKKLEDAEKRITIILNDNGEIKEEDFIPQE